MAAPKGNKFAVGNNGGRPALYSTPAELQDQIDDYFDQEDTKFTVCGLALFLGFTSRQSLLDYQNKDEFTDIIKKARLRIECGYEELLQKPGCTGIIFALKNMGWVDKVETDLNIKEIPKLPDIYIVHDKAECK